MDGLINLDSGQFCRTTLKSRSRFNDVAAKRCHNLKNHSGKCDEFPFLSHLAGANRRVAAKIVRDSIMTTGAAWKSEEAGPNRILRWVMQLSDKDLLKYGINMAALKPQVVAKLREKAADYDSCIKVAMWLTFVTYEMPESPEPPKDLQIYLEAIYGPLKPGRTKCVVCLQPLSFSLFESARRGKAAIETCHKDPRIHSPDNVGFAHRECNIAQGPKTLTEFYDWIEGILKRARAVDC